MSTYMAEFTETNNDKLRIQTPPWGAASLNGVWQTAGFIACYAEV